MSLTQNSQVKSETLNTQVREVDRNSLALDRTVLANERTYQAWIRTGLAALISGLGINKFMNDIEPVWPLILVTIILLFFSAAAFLISAWRYNHLHVQMAHLEVDLMPVWVVKILSIFLSGCSLLALVDMILSSGGS